MKKRNVGALVVFACFYLMQGVIAAFLLTTLYNRLVDQGMSKSEGGMLLAFCSFLWGAKVIFGPLVDRFRSKLWGACINSLVIAALMLLLPMLEGVAFAVILVAIAIPNIAMALQDVMVDGLAIQVLNEKDRGAAQTVMKVAAYFGTFLGGGVAMFATSRIPWAMVCVFVAVFVIITGALTPLILKESAEGTEAGPKTPKSFGQMLKDFGQMFKSPGIYAVLALGLLAYPAHGLTEPIFFAWWKEVGVSKDELALLFSVAPWCQAGGAVLGGVLLVKLSRRRAMETAIFLVCAGYLLLPLSGLWASTIPVIVLSLVTGVVDVIYLVVLYTVMMDASDRRFPATSFALLMAATNISAAWTNAAGGFIGEHVPAMWFFLIAAIAQLVVLVPLKFMKLKVRP